MLPEDINWPCELNQSTKQDLLAIASFKHEPSSRAESEYWKVDGVYYLMQGAATACLPSSDGKKYIGAVIGKGDWMGALAIDGPRPMQILVEQAAPIRSLFFPAKQIMRLAESNDEIYKWLYRSASFLQPRWIRAMVSELFNKRVRVVFIMLELVAILPQTKGALPKVEVSQQQLSNVCGLTRPRVNEVLKELEQEKLIALQRGSIQLLDMNALKQELSGIQEELPDNVKQVLFPAEK